MGYKNEVFNTNLFHSPSNITEWGQYLAGVFEGDSACADVHPHMLASGGYFNANHGITIIFHEKDESSARKLAEWFGHGHVNPVKNKRVRRLVQ